MKALLKKAKRKNQNVNKHERSILVVDAFAQAQPFK